MKGATSVRSLAATVACLAVLVWMNYYLRHTLEAADQHMYSFYKYFYPAQERIVFSSATPWWKLLLPIPQFTGTWNTTTLVMMRLLEDYVRPATAWYVFNAILIVASYWASWAVFRSRVFSLSLAICMGFGTQLYIAYSNSGPISFPLLFAYYELLLLSAYKVITAERHRRLWVAIFVLALLLTALAYEGWLDLLVFAWLAGVCLFVMLGRMGRLVERRRMVAVVAAMSGVGLAYIVTKVLIGYGQSPGMESDVVLNYPFLAPAVEDYLSNTITNFYMAVTNFLPPSLVSSTAFYQLGGEKLVELQHGYHAPFSYLVPMHYLFTWRYFAGMAVAIYVVVTARLVRRCWAEPTADRLALILFLLLMAVAGPTHNFIKFRPMNAMPVQTYHVLTGVLGAALVISLLLMRAWDRLPRPIGGTIVAGGWLVLFYGALARPGLINHQAAQSGIGVQAYPNPMAALMAKIGRPYQLPGGLALYQLEKYSPTAGPAPQEVPARPEVRRFEGGAAPLPNPAPPLSQWSHPQGVSVTVDAGGSVVHGDDTAMGYQLTSPPLAVTPHRTLLVRVSGTVDRGLVCLGALDESQTRWIVPADKTRQEFAVDTAGNRSVTIVFANCMPLTPAPVATQFTVDSVSYGMLTNAEDTRR